MTHDDLADHLNLWPTLTRPSAGLDLRGGVSVSDATATVDVAGKRIRSLIKGIERLDGGIKDFMV